MNSFVHLHNHSHYSLLDGAATIDAILDAAAKHKMPAVALTDHGVLFGGLEFYNKAKSRNINPIIGSEMYIMIGGKRTDRGSDIQGKGKSRSNTHHILLLAKNNAGYKNLMKLTTIAHREGFYYKPRIDIEILNEHREGLIATSACAGGVVSDYIRQGKLDEARKSAGRYKEVFGDEFYIEIQNHGLEWDAEILRHAPAIARDIGLKIVATNDCHYIEKSHALPHNIMLMIPDARNGEHMEYSNLRYGTDQLYFKSSEEMQALFKDFPEAITSTLEIAEKCSLDLKFENLMPEFPIPADSGASSLNEYLELKANEGLKRRYDNLNREISARLEHELAVIKRMGYAGYFLIVQDFINAARGRGVRVGPGRGSAAGSLVSYALGITNVDPLRYGLLFERFLNPDRISMPDIDIDFADDKRELVIEYVRSKYGQNSVAQIVTFNTLSSRAVLKDIGRVLGIHHSVIEPITKNIPIEFGKPWPLARALDEVPELRDLRSNRDEKIRLMIDTALVLEGMNRNVGKHAAGIVITPGDIADYIPLYQAGTGEILTQYNMKDLEKAGLLKMDFLGLRTLTVLEDTLAMVRASQGIDVDLDDLPEKDPETLDLFCKGNTVAIFQFESAGMQDYLRKLKPSSIDDLVAMNALYRPGPMQMIDDFILRKHGKAQIQYAHPALEAILRETYGVIVYQEQVMRIASEIAGLTLAKADTLRRAMGKKDSALMEKQKKEFIFGAESRGIERSVAAEIFELILKFAKYGFNKSHSVAYSVLAYQTAYLKSHYPAEYMAATMTSEKDNTDKIVMLIEDCRKLGIRVLHPDINKSNVEFTVSAEGIRFGLSAIKGVGVAAVQSMTESRSQKGQFTDIFDFCVRVDLQLVNRKTLESLVQAGAFDLLHANRAALMQGIDRALQYGQSAQEASARGQSSLFDFPGVVKNVTRPVLPPAEPWSEAEQLQREKSVLGFYISGHPLRKYEMEVQSFATVRLGDPSNVRHGQPVKACGIITSVKKKIDRKGRTMAFITLEDFSGKAEGIVFGDPYLKFHTHIHPDSLVMCVGKADVDEQSFKVLVNEVVPLDEVRNRLTKKVSVTFDVEMVNESTALRIKQLCEKYRGKTYFYVCLQGGSFTSNPLYYLPHAQISVNDEFLSELATLPGYAGIRFYEM